MTLGLTLLAVLAVTLLTVLWCALKTASDDDEREGRDDG